MLNVSDATKSAYSDDVSKSFIISFPNRNITFTNDDLVEDSIELTEAIENEMAVSFKGCIASKMKFEVADVATDLRGEYVEVSVQAGTTDVIPLFKGYVDSQDNVTFEDIHTEFTCYDVLQKLRDRNMQSWINGLSYPITVLNFRNNLFSTLGITQESKTLINDNLQIKADLKSFVDSPSAVDILRWLCQINAVFGQIGRDGIFHYRELKVLAEGLYPSETTYPSPTTYPSAENAGTLISDDDYNEISYEPYETDEIKKVVIVDKNGVYQGNAGVSGNTFYIQDNPIAYCLNNLSSAANAILAKISYITHIPIVFIRCVGMPYLECGDTYISYTTRNICRTYIFARTLSGLQYLRDEYSSDTNKEFNGYKPTSQSQIDKNKSEIIDNQNNINNVDNRVTDTNTRVTGVDNRVTGVDNRVTGVSNQVTQLGTVVAQKANITDLNATNANVSNLNASKANVSDLNATNAAVQDLNANKASVASLNAVSARVGSLEASSFTTTNLAASIGNITSLRLQTVTASGMAYLQGGTQISAPFNCLGAYVSWKYHNLIGYYLGR